MKLNQTDKMRIEPIVYTETQQKMIDYITNNKDRLSIQTVRGIRHSGNLGLCAKCQSQIATKIKIYDLDGIQKVERYCDEHI